MLSGMGGSPQLDPAVTGIDPAAFAGQELALDEVLGEFAAAGDAESCRATVERLLAAGADRVVLVPNPAGYRSTPEMVQQVQRAAALVD
jgi:alkanesulfonate monooxygenase SsuD/methylene tetrahydromethanopterin reductase-like flavin-dependent oxidoreductase (luciferase family)